MKDNEVDIFRVLAELGEALQVKDFAKAVALWDLLLTLHEPLAEDFPDFARALKHEKTMLELAGRQTTRIH